MPENGYILDVMRIFFKEGLAWGDKGSRNRIKCASVNFQSVSDFVYLGTERHKK